jgi:multiple sugar transport system permease protein
MKIVGRVLVNILILAVVILCLAPFWIVFVMATVQNGTLFTSVPLIPGNQFIINVQNLFSSLNILGNFGNSVLVSASSTIMNLFFSSLAAYAFSKYRFKGKEILFVIVIVTMFVPTQLAWIGFVQEMKAVSLINTLWPLILPSLGTAFGIFVIRGYMSESIPDSIIESAKIDGCRDFMIFIRIVLPLIRPVIASMGILFFMTSWNNYSGPLVILYDSKKYTLPLAIATLNGIFNNNFSVTSAGILISTLPIIIVYIFASKQFIASLTSGAVKE